MKKAAIIISFYNRIDYLKLVLAGFERQSCKDFEVIIADDGSNPSHLNELEKVLNISPLEITHLWQEDKGFRKNKMLNTALTSTAAEYIIFIDGDCVPHNNFVEEHLKNMERNVCLTGRRVNLSLKVTSLLTPDNIRRGYLEKYFVKLLVDGIFGKSFDVEKGFYFKSISLRKFFNKKKRGLLGCNFSILKDDLLSINGFDERYEAPSIGEDSDVQFRLELNNVKIKSLNNIAVQYHLYHKIQPRPSKNLELFEEIKRAKIPFTPYGIHR